LLLAYQTNCGVNGAMHWTEKNMGNLRIALNARVRPFRL
jgi:hypothetical protein